MTPKTSSATPPAEPKASESSEERLSVFEDFLEKLDLDDLTPPAEGDGEDDDEEDKPKQK